jgi:hypothetical protein
VDSGRDDNLAALLAIGGAPDAAFAARVAARITRVKSARAHRRRHAMLLVVAAVGVVSLFGASAAQDVIVAMTPPGHGAYPPLLAWAPFGLIGGFLGLLLHALLVRTSAL